MWLARSRAFDLNNAAAADDDTRYARLGPNHVLAINRARTCTNVCTREQARITTTELGARARASAAICYVVVFLLNVRFGCDVRALRRN